MSANVSSFLLFKIWQTYIEKEEEEEEEEEEKEEVNNKWRNKERKKERKEGRKKEGKKERKKERKKGHTHQYLQWLLQKQEHNDIYRRRRRRYLKPFKNFFHNSSSTSWAFIYMFLCTAYASRTVHLIYLFPSCSSNRPKSSNPNPWRYSPEELRPTQVVAARWQYRRPWG